MAVDTSPEALRALADRINPNPGEFRFGSKDLDTTAATLRALAERAAGPRLICTGCGSVETIEELRAIPGVISCCPERHMVDRMEVIAGYERGRCRGGRS